VDVRQKKEEAWRKWGGIGNYIWSLVKKRNL
jgi:hypothetical protein